VRDVYVCQRIVGNDVDCSARFGTRERALGKQCRQRTFEAAQIQHFGDRFAIIVHDDSS
jgi:hypothetical protein